MQRALFVLSPCGTSLLTNHATGEQRKLIGKHANAESPDAVPGDEAEMLTALIRTVESKIENVSIGEAKRMSAELNGLIGIYADDLNSRSPQDHHLLLCTDTWLGSETARMIATWLKERGLMADIKRQKELQTADLEPFQRALTEIVTWCADTLPGYRSSRYHIIFNLTGGFKSVQGFLQTLAMFYADETVYVFETGDQLLRIPRLPIEMNAVNIARQYLQTFRRLSMRLSASDLTSVPETLLFRIGDEAELSPWGELIWQQAIDAIYAAEILPSPGPKLKYGPKFEKSVAELSPNRRIEVNKKIDDLCRFIESGRQYNLRSLDFKELKGNPLPPSTHECDAWADEDARRLYGHYEADIFILDRLGHALH